MSGYYIKLGHTLRVLFGTSSSTGAAINADATPTVTVYEQGAALGYAPTVTNKATGLYEAEIVCSSGNGFEVGKEYSAAVAAVVAGVTGRDGIASFAIAAASPDDLATAAALATIQTRLPAALVGGRIDASIGAVAADAITAAGLAADVTTELQSGLATAANQATIIGHVDTVEATLATVLGLIDTEIASIKTTVEALPSSSANAAAVLAAVVQTGFTLQRYLKIIGAAVAGKKTGDVFRDIADTQDQITGTSNASGDRTAATYGA